MQQMYKENTTKAIAKKRYSFRKGYLQVTLKDRDELREELKKHSSNHSTELLLQCYECRYY